MSRFTIDENAVSTALDRDGHAVLQSLLTTKQCASVAALYDEPDTKFRSRVVMARHGYGQGEYQYFARPLPDLVQSLREDLYPPLARLAADWARRLSEACDFPTTHAELTAACAAAGQTRPTPLLLRYGPSDYNRLHQDVYGALVFPMQVVVLLSQPGEDFTGGELVLSEGRARMQSRAIVVNWRQGDAVVIPVRERPITGTRGWSKATMRHGVSTIHAGTRRTLGIIFHDAA
jgi:hypothetical protein